MRIGFIYLGRRGAGVPLSFEMATHMAPHAQVLVVLSTQVANLLDWQRSGLELLTVPTYQNMAQAAWSWVDQPRLARLASRIRAWKPDVLVYPMFFTWNPFLQWHLRQIPSLVAVHDPRPHPGLAGIIFRWMENLSIRQAARCLVFSQSLAPELQKRGADTERIDVIPLGMFTYPLPEIKPAPSKPPTLLFFGRITAYKGLEVLLQAFQQVHQSHAAHLLIVGEGDIRPYQLILQQIPDIEVVNRWVAESEIPAFFQRATLVVLPYTSASQSGVLPVAANFGLPVIASRAGGIPEQILHGQTGLLTDPGSVAGLAQAIKQLLDDPILAQTLGENLRMEFQQHRNWAQITQKVYLACEKAVESLG